MHLFFLIIIQKLFVKVKKGEIVDPLHDQGHDQSQFNLYFGFNNQFWITNAFYLSVYISLGTQLYSTKARINDQALDHVWGQLNHFLSLQITLHMFPKSMGKEPSEKECIRRQNR